MTPRERVRAVLEGKRPDKVPLCHVSISSRVASALLGRGAFVGGGINQWREATALWNGPDAHAEFVQRACEDALAMEQDVVRPDYWRLPLKPAARSARAAGKCGSSILKPNCSTSSSARMRPASNSAT